MHRVNTAVVAALALMATAAAAAADARCNDWTIKTGFGEEISVKHGWFGRVEKSAKDRLGDKFVQKKGLFGSRQTEVNLAGNTYKKKKGWFGGSDIEATSIFGDKILTEKGIFGRRKTEVDLSGISSVVRDFFASRAEAKASAGAGSGGLPGSTGGALPGLSSDLPAELMDEPGTALP